MSMLVLQLVNGCLGKIGLTDTVLISAQKNMENKDEVLENMQGLSISSGRNLTMQSLKKN